MTRSKRVCLRVILFLCLATACFNLGSLLVGLPSPDAQTLPGVGVWEASGVSPAADAVRKKLLARGIEPIWSPAVAHDGWKSKLFARLDRIQLLCGELCQLNSVPDLEKHMKHVEGSTLPMVTTAPVHCPTIMHMKDIDASDFSVPTIPMEIQKYYTLNGAYPIRNATLRKDIYLGKTTHRFPWTRQSISRAVEEAKSGYLAGTYGPLETAYVRDVLKSMDLQGKRVLVIGSQNPWLEALALFHGAANVSTLEYGELDSKHPLITAYTPDRFRVAYGKGTLPLFDAVLTHSSLEHSGLGRYGDALNPWGDILAVARVWCVTRPGGLLYLGLPLGQDLVYSNWHRVYGKLRWPLVAANWKPLDKSNVEVYDRRFEESPPRGGNMGGDGRIFQKIVD